MCGRFTLRTPAADLAEEFEVDERPNLAARYNIAPSQDILVVRAAREGGGREFAMPQIGRRRVGQECRSRWSPYH